MAVDDDRWDIKLAQPRGEPSCPLTDDDLVTKFHLLTDPVLGAERAARVVQAVWTFDDPTGLLGQLDDELFRARRLVADTGIHAKHWTRQQAIDYGIEASEVERYVVNPGQACSYMIGQLKLIELRDKAKKALGDKFNIREFHSAVLGAGTILTRSTPLYDLVRNEVYRATAEASLEVPEGAVVVPGSRAVKKGAAAELGISLYTPVIVKYRDEKTDRGIELEDWLR